MIKYVIKSNVPFLGICLGAQILAKYLGCKIEKNPSIKELLKFTNAVHQL